MTYFPASRVKIIGTQNMDHLFIALLKEAQFTYEMLSAGYTQIREANFARKGIYFQAFTSLSTGIERIGKLNLLLDYAINNNGNFPDLQYMKNNIKHDIVKIYNDCTRIKASYSFQFNHMQELKENIYQNILSILSGFGKGDRYSNIDLLVNSRGYNDPISEWYNKIDGDIILNKIKKTKIEKIMARDKHTDLLMSEFSGVYHIDEEDNTIDTVYDMLLKNNINTLVGPYRQLYVYHIIRYFVELLLNIEKYIRNNRLITIPYFYEIFQLFNYPDDFIKNKKTLGGGR